MLGPNYKKLKQRSSLRRHHDNSLLNISTPTAKQVHLPAGNGVTLNVGELLEEDVQETAGKRRETGEKISIIAADRGAILDVPEFQPRPKSGFVVDRTANPPIVDELESL